MRWDGARREDRRGGAGERGGGSGRPDDGFHHFEPGKPSRLRMVMGFGTVFALTGLGLAGGFLITSVIYKITGRPPEFWANVFSGLVGIFVLYGLLGLIGFLRSRARDAKMKSKGFRSYGEIHSQLLDALSEIAHGNFDVLITPEESWPHPDIADAINKMAKNLGNLETMRQDFISNVSHEFQSPLTSISGFAALLKNDDLPAAQRKHYAEIIESESRRLSAMSDNLLKLSALDKGGEPLSRTEFRLDKQLERVALALEPQWAAKRLHVEAELDKVSICGDEGLLSQVWTNLLHNAIKFTPENGSVTMSLGRQGDEVFCRVKDTGIGIAEDEQVHVFERFYKADKARDRSLGGNGLGLALVKKIVELHGGRVSVESSVGDGAAFFVWLPV